jgi:hypothetical protein
MISTWSHWRFCLQLERIRLVERTRGPNYNGGWKSNFQMWRKHGESLGSRLGIRISIHVSLVELSKVEYAYTTMMLTKKDNFINWTKCHICRDYHLMNKWTYLDKYAIPLFKEIFDALGWAKVFNTLDLHFGYH